MAISQANLLVDFSTKVGTITQQTTWRWYKASKFADTFKLRSIEVRYQYQQWRSQLRRYNMDDPEIESGLKHAIQLLDEEEAKIKELQSNCFRRTFTTLLFPEALTEALENICLAFKRLSDRLAERDTIAQQIEKESFNRRAVLPFLPDNKYVEFKSTLVAVRRALESETVGRVVTLFGGPGQGKTSMAKHLALFYQDTFVTVQPEANVGEEVQVHAQNCGSSRGLSYTGFFKCCGLLDAFFAQDLSSDTNLSTNARREALASEKSVVDPEMKRFPDGVFFYTCGPSANSKDIFFELWRDLGYQLLPQAVTEAGNLGETSHGAPKQLSLKSERYLLKELSRRLAKQKILIVLDDVLESMLVEDLLVKAKGVKYLVTTQQSQLWGDSDCLAIPMKSPTSQEAYEILRKQISGFPKELTLELKAAIDALIMKSGKNPLILANLATHIRNPHASSVKEWESAGKQIDRVLVEDVKAVRSPVLFDRSYSKPMRASITMAINDFSEQEQALLLFASMCDVQSIPEVVFKTFFKGIYDDLYWFSRLAENLENKNFLKIESKTVKWSKAPRRSWVVHSMQQNFVSMIKEEEVTSLVAKLLACYGKDKTIVVLLALYGKKDWCDQATKTLTDSRRDRSDDHQEYDSSHFSTIKPFVWLLQGEGEDEGENKSDRWVEKVLHQYLVAGVLDDNSLSRLLAMPETVSATAVALQNMAILNSAPVLTIGHPKTADALLKLLDPSVNYHENWATAALASLLENLKFSYGRVNNNQSSVLQLFPNLGERLIALLAKDVAPRVQGYACMVLLLLSAEGVAYRINIASIPDAIERVMALLVRDTTDDPYSALAAIGLLVNLSGSSKANVIKIASFQGAIEILVALLTEDSLQTMAAQALGNLCSGGVPYATKIASVPGAIEKLVALLAQNVVPSVQQTAARVLARLSDPEVPEIAITIASFPGTIDRLVALLAGDGAGKAAWVLARICLAAKEQADKIASCPGAIERLIALLAKDVGPDVQACAASTLGTLLSSGAENAMTIAFFPRAIERLVTLLAEDVTPNVQRYAAGALADIAASAVENALRIASCPRALEKLSALLNKDGSPDVKKKAASALAQLSCQASKIVHEIALCPGTVERLVALLAENASPHVQVNAALVLGNIVLVAKTATKIASKISSEIASNPGAIEDVVPGLKDNEVLALMNMVAEYATKIASKIASCPGANEGLVELLAKDVSSPKIPERVVSVLKSLSSDVESF